MKGIVNIKEKFELSGGVTVLACSGVDPTLDLTGKRLKLVLDGAVRQTITVSGERKMLKKGSHSDQRALETCDVVSLSAEEARSGDWQLVF